jgi:ABC-type glycerol-3-phosphate transport system substrate-binding protein
MEFLKFLTTTEYQIANLNDKNQMPADMRVFEQIGADYKVAKFGNQNILKTYDEICKAIPEITPDMYTRDVQNMFGKYCKEGIDGGLTDDQILENFKKAIKDKYPDIEGL